MDEIELECYSEIVELLKGIKQEISLTKSVLIKMKQQEKDYWETWKQAKLGNTASDEEAESNVSDESTRYRHER